MNHSYTNNWGNIGLFIVVAGILGWLMASVAGSLVAAWLMAYLLSPCVIWLSKRGVNHSVASMLVFLSGIFIGLLIMALLIPALAKQAVRFAHILPEALLYVQTQWLPVISGYLGVEIPMQTDEMMSWLNTRLHGIHWQDFSPWAHWGFSAAAGIVGSIAGIFKLLLIPLFASYLLHDWEKIIQLFKDHLPAVGKQTLVRLGQEMDTIISVFLRGQFSICAMLTLGYSLGLWMAGIPFAFVIGLIGGLLGFIPYVGYLTGMIAGLLISLWTFGTDIHLVYVLIVFVTVHLIEGFYLVPKVLGGKLGLHPLVLLIALTVAASRFGFIGMLLAVPVTAAGAVLLREVDRRYLSSGITKEDSGSENA